MEDYISFCSSIIRRRLEKGQGRIKLNFRRLQIKFPQIYKMQGRVPAIKYQQPQVGEKNNKFSVSKAVIISPL